MFKVKLGTGKFFTATSIDERWNSVSANFSSSYILNFEASPTDETVDHYMELLQEDGALDTIEVSLDGGEPCATYTGYTDISAVSIRLLVTGEKSASIILTK